MLLWLLGMMVAPIDQWIPPVQTEQVVLVRWFPTESLANKIATRYVNEVGMDMATTMIGENGWFDLHRKSPTNDHWLCQLNWRRHKNFIKSPAFNDWNLQVDYCIGVWKDAVKKKRIPTTFYAYKWRKKFVNRITIVTKQYIMIDWTKIYLG